MIDQKHLCTCINAGAMACCNVCPVCGLKIKSYYFDAHQAECVDAIAVRLAEAEREHNTKVAFDVDQMIHEHFKADA